MSLNILLADGLHEVGKVTKDKVIEALGYVPADENDLPNIVEDESGNLYIADENGNVVAKVDSDGFHAIEVNVAGLPLGQTLAEHIADTNMHITSIVDDESDALSVSDEQGNVIAKIDTEGIHTIEVEAGGIPLASTLTQHISDSTIHVSATDKTNWDNKSDFSGFYDDLEGKPEINEDDSGKLSISDSQGNIIAEFDENGLNTTKVTVTEMVVNDRNVEVEIDSNKTKIEEQTAALAAVKVEVEERLQHFTDDESDELNIVDNDNNVIARFDAAGLTTVDIILRDNNDIDINLRDTLTSIQNELDNKANATETQAAISALEADKASKDELAQAVSDVKNDLLNGAGEAYDTLKELGDLIEENVDTIEALKTIASDKVSNTAFQEHLADFSKHITEDERASWNAKSDFSGNYNDLEDAPSIAETDDSSLIVTDDEGNIIASINSNGLQTTEVTATKVSIDDIDILSQTQELAATIAAEQIRAEAAEKVNADAITNEIQRVDNFLNDEFKAIETYVEEDKKVTIQVGQNTEDIINLKTKTSSLETTANTNSALINSLSSTVSELETQVEANTEIVEDLTSSILTDSDAEFVIVDKEGYIALQVNEQGVEVNTLKAATVIINNINAETKFVELDATQAALDTDLTNHITNTVVHITQEEREYWNNKSEFSGSYNDLTDIPTNLVTDDELAKEVATLQAAISSRPIITITTWG